VVLVGDPLQYTVVDEVVQPVGEDVARYAQPGLEVVKAGHTQEGVADDEQTPPLSDDV
jgi:hypothetical protein